MLRLLLRLLRLPWLPRLLWRLPLNLQEDFALPLRAAWFAGMLVLACAPARRPFALTLRAWASPLEDGILLLLLLLSLRHAQRSCQTCRGGPSQVQYGPGGPTTVTLDRAGPACFNYHNSSWSTSGLPKLERIACL
jgi:hypothetical protein